MYSHLDNVQEHQNKSTVNEAPIKQGENTVPDFVDNSPEAKEAAQLQAMANNSPEAKQMVQLQEIADNNPEAEQTAQLKSIADNSPEAKEAAKLQAMADEHGAQEEQPKQKKVNNTGLPDNLKTGIENLSGFSMDDVKVHYNSSKPAELQAHAYAEGTDIYIGPGQEEYLPHEAWHVVQQKQGRVKPTLQMEGGVDVNDDKGLEKEADVMGAKALRKNNKQEQLQEKQTNNVIQRAISFAHTGKFKQYTDNEGNNRSYLDISKEESFKDYFSDEIYDKYEENFASFEDWVENRTNFNYFFKIKDTFFEDKEKNMEPVENIETFRDPVKTLIRRNKKYYSCTLVISDSQTYFEHYANEWELYKAKNNSNKYLDDLNNTKMWGGYPEAHGIASDSNFKTSIYSKVDNEKTTQIIDIGEGDISSQKLLWTGNHYIVVTINNDKSYNIIHDPVGDGNCLFEALLFIRLKTLNNRNNEEIKETITKNKDKSKDNEESIKKMREIAANHLSANQELLNVLAEEHQDNQSDLNNKISNDIENDLANTILTYILIKYPSDQFKLEYKSKKPQLVDQKNTHKVHKLGNIHIEFTKRFGWNIDYNQFHFLIKSEDKYALPVENIALATSLFVGSTEFNTMQETITWVNDIGLKSFGGGSKTKIANTIRDFTDSLDKKGQSEIQSTKCNKDDPKLQPIKDGVHSSNGIGLGACSIFFSNDGRILAVGRHPSAPTMVKKSSSEYELSWKDSACKDIGNKLYF